MRMESWKITENLHQNGGIFQKQVEHDQPQECPHKLFGQNFRSHPYPHYHYTTLIPFEMVWRPGSPHKTGVLASFFFFKISAWTNPKQKFFLPWLKESRTYPINLPQKILQKKIPAIQIPDPTFFPHFEGSWQFWQLWKVSTTNPTKKDDEISWVALV